MSDGLQTRRREAYYKRLADHGLTPLWTIMAEAVPHEPVPNCDPVFWSFADDIRPALLEAGDLISAEEAQRRVLLLNNPRLQRGTTKTLVAAIQMIKGGEIAPGPAGARDFLRVFSASLYLIRVRACLDGRVL